MPIGRLTVCAIALVPFLGWAESAAAQGAGLLSPVAEAKFAVSEGSFADVLGSSVAISGDTAVVGAKNDDLTVDFPLNEGTAYVFVRSGMGWTQQAKLSASDAGASEDFGSTVAISGDTLVVGARLKDGVAAFDVGAAYVFVRSGTTWSQQAKLTASDGTTSDLFGSAVSVSGDTVVVGAPGDTPFGVVGAGSAYVFVRSGTSWTQQAKLKASDISVGDRFGNAVAVAGETLVIGSQEDDHAAGANAGSAYVFVRTGTHWAEQTRLTAGDAAAQDFFGTSVSISGETVAIGSTRSSAPALPDSGSAYVFVRSGTSWSQQAQVTPSDAAAQDLFGVSVSVSGDVLLVGASLADVGPKPDAGAAYLFVRSGATWVQQARLTAGDAAKDDHFGGTVAVCGDRALVGVPGDDDGSVNDVGSGWAFAFGGFTDLGDGLAGFDGIPKLSGTGTLLAGSGGSLALVGAQPAAPLALLMSLADNPVPFKGGTLHTVPVVLLLAATTSPSGSWSLPWAQWPSGIPAGSQLFFQAVVPDAQAAQAYAISNVLKSTQP
jgi:FG-GAP repeat